VSKKKVTPHHTAVIQLIKNTAITIMRVVASIMGAGGGSADLALRRPKNSKDKGKRRSTAA
jgi:hypothetical protein